MQASLTILQDILFWFDSFCLFEGDLVGVYFFYLLVEEQKVDLQVEIKLMGGNVCFHSEVADVVDLDFFFIVFEEVGFGKKRWGRVVNGGRFDKLTIVSDCLCISSHVVLGESKGMCIYFLARERGTSLRLSAVVTSV